MSAHVLPTLQVMIGRKRAFSRNRLKVRYGATYRIVEAVDLRATTPDAIFGTEAKRAETKEGTSSYTVASDSILDVSIDPKGDKVPPGKFVVFDFNASVLRERTATADTISTVRVMGVMGELSTARYRQAKGNTNLKQREVLEIRISQPGLVAASSFDGFKNLSNVSLNEWTKSYSLGLGTSLEDYKDSPTTGAYAMGVIFDDYNGGLMDVMSRASHRAKLPLPMRVTLDTWAAWVLAFVYGADVVPLGRDPHALGSYQLHRRYTSGRVVHYPAGLGDLIEANSTAGTILLNVRKAHGRGNIIGLLDDLLLEALDKQMDNKKIILQPKIPETLEEQADKLELLASRYRNAATLLRASPNVVEDQVFRDILIGKESENEESDNKQRGSAETDQKDKD